MTSITGKQVCTTYLLNQINFKNDNIIIFPNDKNNSKVRFIFKKDLYNKIKNTIYEFGQIDRKNSE